VAKNAQPTAHIDLDAQFFPNFPLQAARQILACLELSTWELP
jgi:hypothetical protein